MESGWCPITPPLSGGVRGRTLHAPGPLTPTLGGGGRAAGRVAANRRSEGPNRGPRHRPPRSLAGDSWGEGASLVPTATLALRADFLPACGREELHRSRLRTNTAK